jgi:hypothetical protein
MLRFLFLNFFFPLVLSVALGLRFTVHERREISRLEKEKNELSVRCFNSEELVSALSESNVFLMNENDSLRSFVETGSCVDVFGNVFFSCDVSE